MATNLNIDDGAEPTHQSQNTTFATKTRKFTKE